VVDRIFFPINGGLGDAYKGYWSYAPYGKLGALKEAHPSCRIKFIVCSHNPQSAEFYRFHPHIDEVEEHPAVRREPLDKRSPGDIISNKYGKGYTRATKFNKEFSELPYVKPIVHLKNKKERDFIDKIASRGKYICIHPFAGGVVRGVPKVEFYHKIALRVKELGYNAVILGGSYKRETERDTRRTEEVFPYTGSGIINLVNKTNARTAAQLVREGAGFIGTWSCFLCAILDTDIRAVTYIPSGRPALISGGTYKYLSKEIKPIFIDRRPNLPKVEKQTINWFKERK
jgi:hypothetical protein